MAVFTVLTMLAAVLFQAAANRIVFGYLEWGEVRALLSYLGTEMALHYAFMMICMAIAVLLRNNVISMVISICLTMNIMNIVYGALNGFIQNMGIKNFQIYKYTITGRMSLLPMYPEGKECLTALVLAAAFIIVMAAAGSVIFQKRDI